MNIIYGRPIELTNKICFRFYCENKPIGKVKLTIKNRKDCAFAIFESDDWEGETICFNFPEGSFDKLGKGRLIGILKYGECEMNVQFKNNGCAKAAPIINNSECG